MNDQQSRTQDADNLSAAHSWLLPWLLNAIYICLLLVVSPVILWRSVRHGRYRRGVATKVLGRMVPTDDRRPVVWFHAVSVGEVLQLNRLIAGLRERCGDSYAILITTSTDTGYDLAVERHAEDCHVQWFPLDFTWAVNAALKTLRPAMVVLVELELWPNFLIACRKRSIPTAIVNARMSKKSFRGYQRLRRLIAPLFKSLTMVAAQNDEYAERLIALGASPRRTTVTGSIKFDQVQSDRQNSATQRFRRLFQIVDGQPVFIAGSTQAPEETLALDAWQHVRKTFPDLRLILVPRHKERFHEVAQLVSTLGLQCVCRSSITEADHLSEDHVILLDTIGELGACWGLADVAFVGGSFGSRGGQNMLEPAAYGAAVMVGPNTSNFREIVFQLERSDGIVCLEHESDLAEQLQQLLTSQPRRRDLGKNARQFVMQQQGAVNRTLDCVEAVLVPQSRSESAVAERPEAA